MEQIIFIFLLVLQLEIITAFILYAVRNTSINKSKGASFIDTSVLMDGRIIEAVKAGFIPDKLVVPQSVIRELQLLADGSDSDRRAKARAGLDVVALLREMTTDVEIMDDGKPSDGVDHQLLLLAKKHYGSICTVDYNLNKVATAEGIKVLNINELAKQLRITYLPGEKISLTIIQKGNDPHQGIGYLEDGTMVVVDQASSEVGREILVEFTRSLQTAAGRMFFAKRVRIGSPKSSKPKPNANKHAKNRRPGRERPTTEDSLINLVNKQ